MISGRYKIGSTYISRTNPEDARSRIEKAAKEGKGGYICVSDMRMVRYAGSHKDYRKLMEGSLMNLPDGTPVSWIGRLSGCREVACTTGPGLFASMMGSADPDLRHYLLGDTRDVLDAIVERSAREGGAQIVGTDALPFTTVDKFDYQGIARGIKESGANIVWTAMRAPKQDEFNARICPLLEGVVCIGVGRAFRLYSGDIRQAPAWARKLGIGGLFIRRKSLGVMILWYIETAFVLFAYACRALWNRLFKNK